MESYLFKKQGKGINGMHVWKRRFFVFDPSRQAVYYFHERSELEEGVEPRGKVKLAHISDVRWLADKKSGRRFDITITSGKKLALLALKRSTAKAWVELLTTSITSKKSIMDRLEQKDRGQDAVSSGPLKLDDDIQTDTDAMMSSKRKASGVNIRPLSMKLSTDAPLTPRDSCSPLGDTSSSKVLDESATFNASFSMSSGTDAETENQKERLRKSFGGKMASSRRNPLLLSYFASHFSDLAPIGVSQEDQTFESLPYLLKSVKKYLNSNRLLFDSESQLHMELVPSSDEKDMHADEEAHDSIDVESVTSVHPRSPLSGKGLNEAFNFLSIDNLLSLNEFSVSPGDDQVSIPEKLQVLVVERIQDPHHGLRHRNIVFMYKLVENCFSGREFVSWIFNEFEESDHNRSVRFACAIGDKLLELGLIVQVDEVYDNEVIRLFRKPEFIGMRCSWTLYRVATSFEKEILSDWKGALHDIGIWVFRMRHPKTGIQLRTIKRGLKTRHSRFTVQDGVKWLIANGAVSNESDAVNFIKMMQQRRVVFAVEDQEVEDQVLSEHILKFNPDLKSFQEEFTIRKALASSEFKTFFNQFRTDKDLLLCLLEEHVTQLSLESKFMSHHLSRADLDVKETKEVRETRSEKHLRTRSSSRGLKLYSSASSPKAEDVFLSDADTDKADSDFIDDSKSTKSIRKMSGLAQDLSFSDHSNGEDSPEEDLLLSKQEKSRLLSSGLIQEPTAMKNKDEIQLLHNFLFLYSLDFKDQLKCVFRSSDSECHALALDVFWAMQKFQSLKEHFCVQPVYCEICQSAEKSLYRFVQRFCSGRRFNPAIKASLLSMLFDNTWSRIRINLALSQRVRRPGLWKCFIDSMQGATVGMRRFALRDISALLTQRADNALDLSKYDGWYKWISPFCFGTFDDLQINVSMSHNILAQVLYHNFFVSPKFASILYDVIEFLRQYELRNPENSKLLVDETEESTKGTASRSQSLNSVRTVLEVLCVKISERTQQFCKPPDSQDTVWMNLMSLINVVFVFIFHTPKWGIMGSSPTLGGTHLMENQDGYQVILWPALIQDSISKSLTKFCLHKVQVSFSTSWASDMPLASKLGTLLKALKVSSSDLESLIDASELSATDKTRQKQFVQNLAEKHKFFDDLVKFLRFVSEFQDIYLWNRQQVMLYLHIVTEAVQMSQLCKKFIHKAPAKRDKWIEKQCRKHPKSWI